LTLGFGLAGSALASVAGLGSSSTLTSSTGLGGSALASASGLGGSTLGSAGATGAAGKALASSFLPSI